MARIRHKAHPFAKGFTLIELLVVISIIALLVLFTMPLINTLRERVDTTRCSTNLRAVGMAVLSYAVDNENMIMPPFAADEPAGNDRNWPWKVVNRGYLPQRTGVTSALTDPAFYCPLSSVSSYDEATSWAQVYGLRQWRDPGASRHEEFKPISTVSRPHDFVLLADSFRPSSGLPWYAIGVGSNANNARIHLRHGGRANCFMLDGRVASLDAVDLERLGEATREYAWNPVYLWGN